jgi:hypothetical protein
MCDRTEYPPYDPPISEAQREALAVLRLVDDWETRLDRRRRNLMALGFDADTAASLARASWRIPPESAA